MDKENFFAVIMAGGKGERFWPQSRSSTPKPLLRLVGDLSLIEQTVERIRPLTIPENILIITNRDYLSAMKSLIPSVPAENIIGEPVGRDTAPCIALASAVISSRSQGRGNPLMAILPADHVIKDTNSFLQAVNDSSEMAAKENIVAIGINPTYASTGFGYIHCGPKLEAPLRTVFYKGLGFKEKPNLATAENFLKDGSYKWNGGIFIWSLKTILDSFKKFSPELHNAITIFKKAADEKKLDDSLDKIYPLLPKISIDYAIMEKSQNIVVAESSFPWDDVGSWNALRNQIRPSENNNIIRGLYSGIDTKNCIIIGDSSHLIGTIDVDDLIIVHTSDVTLVCSSKSAQRVKELVQLISSKPELKKYL